MVNKRKVRLMARTAMYERKEIKNDLPKAKYYKNDYVGLHMWITAVAVTIAFFLIILLVVACNFEYFINNILTINYALLGVILILIYIAMMTFFMLIAYFVYSYRYLSAESEIKTYQNRLHKIYLMNKEDKKNKGGL